MWESVLQVQCQPQGQLEVQMLAQLQQLPLGRFAPALSLQKYEHQMKE